MKALGSWDSHDTPGGSHPSLFHGEPSTPTPAGRQVKATRRVHLQSTAASPASPREKGPARPPPRGAQRAAELGGHGSVPGRGPLTAEPQPAERDKASGTGDLCATWGGRSASAAAPSTSAHVEHLPGTREDRVGNVGTPVGQAGASRFPPWLRRGPDCVALVTRRVPGTARGRVPARAPWRPASAPRAPAPVPPRPAPPARPARRRSCCLPPRPPSPPPPGPCPGSAGGTPSTTVSAPRGGPGRLAGVRRARGVPWTEPPGSRAREAASCAPGKAGGRSCGVGPGPPDPTRRGPRAPCPSGAGNRPWWQHLQFRAG